MDHPIASLAAALSAAIVVTLAGCGSATKTESTQNKSAIVDQWPADYAKIRGRNISVNVFEQLTEQEQLDYLQMRINALIAVNNLLDQPFAVRLREYFQTVPPGRKMSPGVADFYALLRSVDQLAKRGAPSAPDLHQLGVDDLFLKVTKDKFPAQFQKEPTPEQQEGLRKYKELTDQLNKMGRKQ